MERNLIGEMNMMKESGAKPNFTTSRGGTASTAIPSRSTGTGAARSRPTAGRAGGSGFDRYRAEIEGKAALPGMTKRGLHEFLLDRHAGDEPPVPGYNAFTHYLRTRGIAVGAGSPEAHPPLRDRARRAAPVRLEGGRRDARPLGRRVPLQRVLRDARVLEAPPVPQVADQDPGRPAGLHVRRRGEARGRPRRVAHRQHVRDRRGRRGRQAGARPARRALLPRGRLPHRALRAEDAPDQGQGGEREPLPLEAPRLRGGTSTAGRASTRL